MKVKAVKVNRAHYFLTDPRINVEFLYDSTTTGFYKPTTNYLLNTTAQMVQQRATNVQPTMQSQNEIFPSFACDLQTHSN